MCIRDSYSQGDFLIKIDHHPNDDVYGDLSWVDTSSSSASEMITLFAEITQLALSDRAAELLFAGIVGDTGRFLYPSTTARTLRPVSYTHLDVYKRQILPQIKTRRGNL